MVRFLRDFLGVRRLPHVIGVSALAITTAALFLAGAAASQPLATNGGSLTFLSASDVGSLDPGRVCAEYDYMVVAAVNRGLFYYKPGDYKLSQLTPDLASRPAAVSKDGKTVTVHLRPNVRFAPPVNRAVTVPSIACCPARRLVTCPPASKAPKNDGAYRAGFGIR